MRLVGTRTQDKELEEEPEKEARRIGLRHDTIKTVSVLMGNAQHLLK